MGQVQQLELERSTLQQHLGDAQEDLKQERSKVTQLEGELVTVDVVKEGMYRELEKVCVRADGRGLVWCYRIHCCFP